jgi:hypothetical protein
VLDDHICHQLTISVSFLVKAVHSIKVDSIGNDIAVVCTSKYRICCLVNTNTPDPVLNFTDFAELDTFFIPKGDLFVATCHYKVFTCWVKRNAARIESELFVRSNRFYSFTTLDGEDRKLLIPASCDQEVVVSVEFLWTERKCPDWVGRLSDHCKLVSIFVSKQDCTVEKTDCENLTVRRPVSTQALNFSLVLLNIRTFSLPKTKVIVCARCQRLEHWIENQCLNFVHVRVS